MKKTMDEEKTIDDGGSLYPTDSAAGMSMRDYFASDQTASLLIGLLYVGDDADTDVDFAKARQLLPQLVDLGYVTADAMIERRKR